MWYDTKPDLSSSSQAREVEENLLKTKEELQIVMTSTTSAPAPPAAPASSSSSSSSDSESDHEQSEHSEENSTYSAELQTQGINDHRQEEERVTEAEKNERLQKKLMVSSGSQETIRIWTGITCQGVRLYVHWLFHIGCAVFW